MNSSSLDPTFMLSGTMAHTAMQIGLHRPGNAQDFSKFRIRLSHEDLEDRMKTWAACNIVMQRFVLNNPVWTVKYSCTDMKDRLV